MAPAIRCSVSRRNPRTLGNRARATRPIIRLVVALVALTQWAAPELASQSLDTGAYRQLLIDYRAGARDEAIARLAAAGSRSLQERNDILLAGLDLDRPEEQRLWLAAMLIHAELATLPGPEEASDRFMDEFLDAGALPTLHDRYGLSTDAVCFNVKSWVG